MLIKKPRHSAPPVLPDVNREPRHTAPPVLPDVDREPEHTTPPVLPDVDREPETHCTICPYLKNQDTVHHLSYLMLIENNQDT